MTEDKNKKVEAEINDEQLNEVSGGGYVPYDHVVLEPFGPAPGGQSPSRSQVWELASVRPGGKQWLLCYP